MKCCGECGFGWRRENGMIACGAPVDDDALKRMNLGKNPAWAWRKYGPFAMFAIATGNVPTAAGTDCENMSPDDGRHCVAWKIRVDGH